MMLSGREASRVLCDAIPGSGLTRERARRVLEAGFAGDPVVTSSAKLYDADSVAALAARPLLGEQDLIGRFPNGIFVARRDVDLRVSAAEQRAALSCGWRLTTPLLIGFAVAKHLATAVDPEADPALPVVATVCGFVATGAELIGCGPAPDGKHGLLLREPGPWFEDLRDVRIRTGPGAPWWLSTWSRHGWPSRRRALQQ